MTKSLWRALRRAGIVSVVLCLLWVAGLIWFATPPAIEDQPRPTDAIVVLTGGSLRLHSGIELLRQGRARKLFVSGVNQEVDLEELLRISGNDPDGIPDWALCCLALGHEASDTLGNAHETARWMRRQGYRSLRLVTAWYHMPRSLLEFTRAMPEIEIVGHPVFPDQVKRQRWWVWPGTAALLSGEYAKYLAAMFRPLIERPKPRDEAAEAETR